jgi:dGTPase
LPPDQRDHAQQDRDRILYSSAFQRLAGITQVISPTERRVCHNRLTHSLKVAQVARRLAEYLVSSSSNNKLKTVGGIHPDVVEAASLAHDLGHPPFGHAAELALKDSMIKILPLAEPFEGNPQSFRVVTKLAVRSEDFSGLDLTRATLNALLKYPWLWKHRSKPDKWGAYKEDKEAFDWARYPLATKAKAVQTIEAEIMDTADDISYAVHDLEDFYRAGIVPLDRLVLPESDPPRLSEEGDNFVLSVFKRHGAKLPGSPTDLRTAFEYLLANNPVLVPYKGLRGQRAAIRAFTSSLIASYIRSSKLASSSIPGQRLFLPQRSRYEIFMLQELTKHYMILHPSLGTQQVGQRKLVKELFQYFYEAATSGQDALLPPRCREMIEPLVNGTLKGSKKKHCARLAADMVSSLTELEAKDLAHKILGISLGSAFDPLS